MVLTYFWSREYGNAGNCAFRILTKKMDFSDKVHRNTYCTQSSVDTSINDYSTKNIELLNNNIKKKKNLRTGLLLPAKSNEQGFKWVNYAQSCLNIRC